jgi:hypothetical protein
VVDDAAAAEVPHHNQAIPCLHTHYTLEHLTMYTFSPYHPERNMHASAPSRLTFHSSLLVC